ncbi:twin-arginine translocation signal domain-containing protein [Streptomyces sp. NPDC006476]|uniref:twin-arginine translocation signal domain-containing protein n=1 Tax=Streptomyces sp. NPDC006476 TaxID=3157175 RepID=UPI0033A5DE20
MTCRNVISRRGFVGRIAGAGTAGSTVGHHQVWPGVRLLATGRGRPYDRLDSPGDTRVR